MQKNNSLSESRAHLWILTLLFALPFVLIMVAHFLMGVEYYTFSNDGTASYFGLGLSWVMGVYPKLYFHQPSYFFQEIAALFILLSGLPEEDLHAFNNLALFANFVFIFVSAYWTAFIAKSTELSGMPVLIVAMIAASMPISILCSTMWTFNFPIVTLSVPLGLSLAAIAFKISMDEKLIKLTFFVFGFFLANYFLALVVLMAWICAQVYDDYLEHKGQLADFYVRVVRQNVITVLRILLPIFAISAIWTGINFIVPQYQQMRMISMGILCFFIGLCSYYIYRKRNVFFSHEIYWGIWGWVLGANLMALPWLGAMLLSFTSTGGTQYTGERFTYLAEPSHFSVFLAESPWHFFIPILVVLFVISLLRYKKYKPNGLPKFVVFGSITFLLNIFLVGDLTFSIFRDPVEEFGLTSRYFLPLLMPLCGFIYCINRFSYAIRVVILGIVLFVSLASTYKYIQIAPTVVETTGKLFVELDRLIDEHLATDPENIVYFVETVYPEKASVLYAFNRHRRAYSIEIWKKDELENGRLRFTLPDQLSMLSLESLERALFVREGQLPEGFDILYESKGYVVGKYNTNRQ